MAEENRLEKFSEFVKSVFLPTSTEWFKRAEANIHNAYDDDIRALESDRDMLKYLLLASRSRRTQLLQELRKTWPEDIDITHYGKAIADHTAQPTSSGGDAVERISTLRSGVHPLSESQEKKVKEYLDYVQTTSRLRTHLDEVDQDFEKFKYMVETQATAELTNYRGFSDWGKTMRSYVSTYATGLAALSIAGAGLVYSTIFGASRGNVDLMSWTFPLFTVGFLIPGFVHIATFWASVLPQSLAFASQRFWTAAIFFALLMATIMVIGAIIIVNITILLLDPNAPVIAKKSTFGEVAGIFSLAFSGSVILLSVCALFLGFFSRRLKTTVENHRKASRKERQDALNTYNHV